MGLIYNTHLNLFLWYWAVYNKSMRVYIISKDCSGEATTVPLQLRNCSNTTELLLKIANRVSADQADIIVTLRSQPYNIRLIEGWLIHVYPIENGSVFDVKYIEQGPRERGSVRAESQISDLEVKEGSTRDHSHQKLSLRQDDEDIMEKYLEQLLDKVRKGKLDQVAEFLKTPLIIDDNVDSNATLLAHNQYFLNSLGECGRNCLHWAIHCKNIELVTFLLVKGADANALTLDDYTPLQLAVLYRSSEIASLLLPNCNANQVTSKGTAFHLAVKNEDMNCLGIFLKCGVDSQIRNFQGLRPIETGVSQKIKQLLKKDLVERVMIPNITKGGVIKVSSMAYRRKEAQLLINPFKNQLTLGEEKFRLTSISKIEFVLDKSFLMKSDLHYVRIQIDENVMILAFKHKEIKDRWVEAMRLSVKFANSQEYVSKEQHIVEIIDDNTNRVELFKRKVAKIENRISVMDMHDEGNPYRSSQSTATQTNSFRSSEILLGSVLGSIIEFGEKLSGSNAKEFKYEPVQEISFQVEEESSERFKNNPRHATNNMKEIVPPLMSFKKKKNVEITLNKLPPAETVSLCDFEIGQLLGSGSFGKVYLARHKPTKKDFALKVLNKKKLIAKKQLKYAVGEANILKKLDHPFIVRLHYAFQTAENLYMALENYPNGDLSQLILIQEKLKEETSKFFIAQIVLAIEEMHSKKILYRDLKPQNILIGRDGYVCVTDFGLSREKTFSQSFCGSHAYLSPEMLAQKGVGFSTDIYGIGCVLYQMLTGQPPYFDEDKAKLHANIKSARLRYPDYLSKQARSLVAGLLERDISKRLGVADVNEIKRHEFFKTMNWTKLQRKELAVPSQILLSEAESPVSIKKEGKLNDIDYEGQGEMLNRIKNFTFVRH